MEINPNHQRLKDKVKATKLEPPGLVIKCAANIEPESISWLWRYRIALGKSTIIAGEPGLGKSQLAAYLSAAVSNGSAWPDAQGSAPLGSVIILSAEDDAADTIVPRLMAAGADRNKVHIISAVIEDKGNGRRSFNLQADLRLLEAAINKINDVKLIIIDPISSYLGRVDSHKNSEVRSVLAPLIELAARLGVAIVMITHFNKSVGASANHRMIESIGFIASARAGFIVTTDPDDEQRRLFVPSKSNLGPPMTGLGFKIELRKVKDEISAPAIAWDSKPVTVSADEAIAEAANESGSHTAKADAMEFLKGVLKDGPLTVLEIQNQARNAGLLGEGDELSQCKPFRSARNALGVVAERIGFGPGARWVWKLPAP